jgi:hypothetical protein
MAANKGHKTIKSKYYGVTGRKWPDKPAKWLIIVPGLTNKMFDNEREAAKAIDIWLIKQGKEPVNVLKKK